MLHEDRDFDFTRCNHRNIDPCIGERAEHAVCNTNLFRHPESHDRNLSHAGTDFDMSTTKFLKRSFNRVTSRGQIIFQHGKRNICFSIFTDILNYHVHGNMLLGNPRKNCQAGSGAVRDIFYRYERFVLRNRRPSNCLIGRFRIGNNQRSDLIGKTMADVDRNVVSFGKFDGATMQYSRTKARKFQHFVVAYLLNFACFRQDSWIGGINPCHIGVNFTRFGAKHRRKCNRGKVTPAPAEGGNVEIFINTLKPGSNDDVAIVK